MYTNECASWEKSQQNFPSLLPASLDFISVDSYSGFDPNVPGTNELKQVKEFVDILFPKLHAHQRVVLVPGVFGCRNFTYFPLAQQEDHVLAKLDAYLEWMNNDTRIIGLNPYHWKTRGHDSPAWSRGCDLALGASDMPRVVARLRQIGLSIVNRTLPAGHSLQS